MAGAMICARNQGQSLQKQIRTRAHSPHRGCHICSAEVQNDLMGNKLFMAKYFTLKYFILKYFTLKTREMREKKKKTKEKKTNKKKNHHQTRARSCLDVNTSQFLRGFLFQPLL